MNFQKMFEYFSVISQIPRGSGNSKPMGAFLEDFAKEHKLDYYRDESDNVIIYKKASVGYENAESVILQGHTDMVCQKTEDCNIDFEKDGISIYEENGYIKAKDTTLGADNGIAVAMILAILESDEYLHPSLEAVFTADEEIGMVGADALDYSKLNSKMMINLDAEEPESIIASCAGGVEVVLSLPYERVSSSGTKLEINIKGLKGGHSGVEIHKGRLNANLVLGRILNHLSPGLDFNIISVFGGDKSNAITPSAKAEIVVEDAEKAMEILNEYFEVIKTENSGREENIAFEINRCDHAEYKVIDENAKENLVFLLATAPNGVMEMSCEIENLVETSLNLGILKTTPEKICLTFAIRSNKNTALSALEEKIKAFGKKASCLVESCGSYKPWEYKGNSYIREVYKKAYAKKNGKEPTVIAIHAGLECSAFASNIQDLDCIAVGPEVLDAHTVCERLNISSAKEIFEVVLETLKELKSE